VKNCWEYGRTFSKTELLDPEHNTKIDLPIDPVTLGLDKESTVFLNSYNEDLNSAMKKLPSNWSDYKIVVIRLDRNTDNDISYVFERGKLIGYVLYSTNLKLKDFLEKDFKEEQENIYSISFYLNNKIKTINYSDGDFINQIFFKNGNPKQYIFKHGFVATKDLSSNSLKKYIERKDYENIYSIFFYEEGTIKKIIFKNKLPKYF